MNKQSFLSLMILLAMCTACSTPKPPVQTPEISVSAPNQTIPAAIPTLRPPATATATSEPPTPTPKPAAGTVLLAFGDRFIDVIYTTVRPAIEEAGYDVVVASRALETLHAKGVDLQVEVDLLLEDVQVDNYTAVVFLCDNDLTFGSARRETDRIAQQASAQGVVLAAICSGPRILAYAQVVDGLTVTGEPSQTCQMLRQAGASCTSRPVERDGLVVTARDRYASQSFVREILAAIEEANTPAATSTPAVLLNLAYSQQAFTSPETFQAGLGDLDMAIGRFNGGVEIWFNMSINEAYP